MYAVLHLNTLTLSNLNSFTKNENKCFFSSLNPTFPVPKDPFPDPKTENPVPKTPFPNTKTRFPDLKSGFPDTKTRFQDPKSSFPDRKTCFQDPKTRFQDRKGGFLGDCSTPPHLLGIYFRRMSAVGYGIITEEELGGQLAFASLGTNADSTVAPVSLGWRCHPKT